MPSRIPSVNPAKHPNEIFELWSIPAFDEGQPQVVPGSEIGSSKKCVEPGDVLLSRIVPHIRRSWVVTPKTNNRQIASGEWITFRSDKFDAGYMRHILISDPFHTEFIKTVAGVGGSLLRARPEGVRQIEIPLPSLKEQKRIAAILDQADELRRLRKTAITKLNTLWQSLFYEMFGDPAINPSQWPMGTIRDLVAEVRYGTSKKAHTEARGLPILRMGNITYGGEIDLDDLKYVELADKEVEKYTARKGDILFNRTNSKDLVGKTAIYDSDEPMAIAGYLVRARVNDQADPYYIGAYMNSKHGKATLRNMCKNIVGMANINAQEFQDIPIATPPIELQREFRNRIEGLTAPKDSFQQSRCSLDHLFASLQHRAFRGEL